MDLNVDVILRQDGKHVCVWGQSDVNHAAAAVKVLCKCLPPRSAHCPYGHWVYWANAEWAARVLGYHGFSVLVEENVGARSWFESWRTDGTNRSVKVGKLEKA
jgi:hypothetical protein